MLGNPSANLPANGTILTGFLLHFYVYRPVGRRDPALRLFSKTSTRSSSPDRPARKLHQPTGRCCNAVVLKRHSHGLCAPQYRLQGTKGCLPTCRLTCCKPEAAVSPSEISACYRLYAACCAEIARRASEQSRRTKPLNLAQMWLRLVRSVRRQTGTSGRAMPRLPTQRAEIVTWFST